MTHEVKIKSDYLYCPRIELFGCGSGNAGVVDLPLTDHVYERDAGEDDADTPEFLKPVIGPMRRLMAR